MEKTLENILNIKSVLKETKIQKPTLNKSYLASNYVKYIRY